MPSALVLHLNGDFFTLELPDVALSASSGQEEEPDQSQDEDVQVKDEDVAPDQTQDENVTPDLTQDDQIQDEDTLPHDDTDPPQDEDVDVDPDPIVTITISAAGDVTFGGSPASSGYLNYMREFEEIGSDFTYYFRNVKHIFTNDDLTVINLEGTLTEETKHRGNTYNFRADPIFAKALSSSGIEAVSLANNHSGDFLEKGYEDTKESLEAEGVAYFGNKTNTILEIKALK